MCKNKKREISKRKERYRLKNKTALTNFHVFLRLETLNHTLVSPNGSLNFIFNILKHVFTKMYNKKKKIVLRDNKSDR